MVKKKKEIPKIEYKVTDRFNEDCINEILRIEKEKGLTAESLVEMAKDEDNPLHNFFEWEDSLAGEKWRLQQARVLINEVKVIIEEKEYYAFENVQIAVLEGGEQQVSKNKERVYKPVIEIISNQELRRQIVDSALNKLSYWEEQNSKYEELHPIIKSAQKVREQLDKEWQKKKKKL